MKTLFVASLGSGMVTATAGMYLTAGTGGALLTLAVICFIVAIATAIAIQDTP